MVLLDGQGHVAFGLDEYTNNSDVASEIRKSDYSEGGTDVAAGMHTALTEVFAEVSNRDAVPSPPIIKKWAPPGLAYWGFIQYLCKVVSNEAVRKHADTITTCSFERTFKDKQTYRLVPESSSFISGTYCEFRIA
ncbi:unnamed protein product [Anisakis simplex]|uniref:Uncharacterized protein n=1 Tax=Anisakis simplex TaxID=6269 RepID=A0A0M3J7E8_ANISI|nr:unnamed protein product [Anisakis simplex]